MIHARHDYNDFKKVDEKIPDNEPVFLLRGQDELAVETVKFYIRLRNIKYGTNDEISKILGSFLPTLEKWPKKKKADL